MAQQVDNAQCGRGGDQGCRQGGAGVVWSVKAGHHVGDSIGCWVFGEMLVVIDMVDGLDDREVHKVEVVTKD